MASPAVDGGGGGGGEGGGAPGGVPGPPREQRSVDDFLLWLAITAEAQDTVPGPSIPRAVWPLNPQNQPLYGKLQELAIGVGAPLEDVTPRNSLSRGTGAKSFALRVPPRARQLLADATPVAKALARFGAASLAQIGWDEGVFAAFCGAVTGLLSSRGFEPTVWSALAMMLPAQLVPPRFASALLEAVPGVVTHQHGSASARYSLSNVVCLACLQAGNASMCSQGKQFAGAAEAVLALDAWVPAAAAAVAVVARLKMPQLSEVQAALALTRLPSLEARAGADGALEFRVSRPALKSSFDLFVLKMRTKYTHPNQINPGAKEQWPKRPGAGTDFGSLEELRAAVGFEWGGGKKPQLQRVNEAPPPAGAVAPPRPPSPAAPVPQPPPPAAVSPPPPAAAPPLLLREPQPPPLPLLPPILPPPPALAPPAPPSALSEQPRSNDDISAAYTAFIRKKRADFAKKFGKFGTGAEGRAQQSWVRVKGLPVDPFTGSLPAAPTSLLLASDFEKCESERLGYGGLLSDGVYLARYAPEPDGRTRPSLIPEDNLLALKIVRARNTHDAGALKELEVHCRLQAAARRSGERRMFVDMVHCVALRVDTVEDHVEIAEDGDVDKPESLLLFQFMQLCSATLLDRVNSGVRIEERERFYIAERLTRSVAFLHTGIAGNPGLHLDIKPSNVFLDDSGSVLLGDFSLSRLGHHGPPGMSTLGLISSANFMPPEMMAAGGGGGGGHPVTDKADVWLLGQTLFFIFSGRLPFVSCPLHLPDARVEHNTRVGMRHAPFWEHLPPSTLPAMVDLIWWTLQHDPRDRPSISSVLSHPAWWSFLPVRQALDTLRTHGAVTSPSKTCFLGELFAGMLSGAPAGAGASCAFQLGASLQMPPLLRAPPPSSSAASTPELRTCAVALQTWEAELNYSVTALAARLGVHTELTINLAKVSAASAGGLILAGGDGAACLVIWLRNYWAHVCDGLLGLGGIRGRPGWAAVLRHHPYCDAQWEDPLEFVLRHGATGWFFPALWRAVHAASLAGINGAEEDARLLHARVPVGVPAYSLLPPTPRASPLPPPPPPPEAGTGGAGGSGRGAGAMPPPPAVDAGTAPPAATPDLSELDDESPPPPPPPLEDHPDFMQPPLLAAKGGAPLPLIRVTASAAAALGLAEPGARPAGKLQQCACQ